MNSAMPSRSNYSIYLNAIKYSKFLECFFFIFWNWNTNNGCFRSVHARDMFHHHHHYHRLIRFADYTYIFILPINAVIENQKIVQKYKWYQNYYKSRVHLHFTHEEMTANFVRKIFISFGVDGVCCALLELEWQFDFLSRLFRCSYVVRQV